MDLPNAGQLGNATQNVASNGATPTANNIQFNGIDANNLAENSAATAETSEVGTAIPAPDSIQEFRVANCKLRCRLWTRHRRERRSGKQEWHQQFHGSAWEFVRNNIFNANDFFSKLDGQPRPDLKQNQFGGSFGGPIKHDKTFFFAAYQGNDRCERPRR